MSARGVSAVGVVSAHGGDLPERCLLEVSAWGGGVYPSMHWAGECLPRGVYPSMHWARGCLPRGVSAQGVSAGAVSAGGVSTWRCLYPSMHLEGGVCWGVSVCPEGGVCLGRCLLGGVCLGCVSQYAWGRGVSALGGVCPGRVCIPVCTRQGV